MPIDRQPQIAVANRASLNKTLEWFFGPGGHLGRNFPTQTLSVDELACDGLLEARRDGRLVGAILYVIQPGKTALLWPPRIVKGEPSTTSDRLIDMAERQLSEAGISMAHVVLPAIDERDDHLLRSHDYFALAPVLYLASTVRDLPISRPETLLEFEPYESSNHERLAHLVEASYEQTRDCPRLGGVRTVEEVLDGYRQSGEFNSRHWLIVRHRGKDVGVLILTDHPADQCCELVYMGLTLSSRGHGWGKQIARHAQWLTLRAGNDQLVLAVDSENDPAVSVYTSVGFHVWDRRTVYVKLLRPDSSGKK